MKKIFAASFIICFALLFSIQTLAQKKSPTLNHIAHYVVNLKVSTDFYLNIVGLDSIPEPFHDGLHTWLSMGGKAQLHLIAGAPAGLVHDKYNHLCFSVTSMENFVAALTKANIPYQDWPGKPNTITTRPDGIKQIFFTDPDGYWIEVNNDYK